MQGKKRYLVIALFLILGLTTFTFANPKEELSSQKKSSSESEKITSDKKENKSYADAIEAVEEAEANPTEANVVTARNEITTANDATPAQVQELQTRITVVEESIDVAALVTEVETLAEVEETREEAREKYQTAETEVNKLTDGDVKTNLQTRLVKVSRLLNDTTAPSVTGIDEDKPTNKNEIVYVSDEFLNVVTIDGVEYTQDDFTTEDDTIKFQKKITKEGTHTVVATDKLGNSTKKTFVIDKTAATAEVTKSNNDKGTNQDVTVTLKTNEEIVAPEGWTVVTEGTEFTNVYSENGKYEVTIMDKAGNETTVKFEVKRIDKVAPSATVTMSNKNGSQSTNEDVTVTLVSNEAIYKPEGWTEVSTNKEHEFTKVYSENGKYEVVITDKGGNTTTVKFEVKRIDKIAPVVTVVEPNKYQLEVYSEYVDKGYSAYDVVDKDVSNTIKITYQFQAKASSNWEVVDKLDTSKLGTYKLTYTANDKAGNTAKGTRVVEIVDTTAPLLTLNGEKTLTLEAGIDTYEELGATATDNYDETVENIQPNFIHYRDKDGNFIGKVDKVDTTKPGEYKIQYTHTDSNLNVGLDATRADHAYVLRVVNVVDTINPTLTIKDDAVGSNPYSKISFKLSDSNQIDYFELNGTKFDRTNAKYSDANYQNIKSALIEGENTIVLYDTYGNKTEQKFIIDWTLPQVITESQEYETKDGGRTKVTIQFSEELNASPGQGWYKDNSKENTYYKHYYRAKEYTVTFKDLALNENSYTIKINENISTVNVLNVTEDISLVDQPFYNVNENTTAVTINGNGKTVTQTVTSDEKFNWTESGSRPTMGNMFSSKNGSKLTINDLTFKGTVQSISLGNYLNYKVVGLPATYNFNTELNNVNVIGLNVVSYSAGISPAVVIYGTATLNNTNIYDTKLSELDTDPMWPVYDLAVVNYTNTTINGGHIGSIYAWKHAKLVIKAGSTVDSINVTLGTPATNIVVEEGATVGKIITSTGEMTFDEWQAA